MGSRIIQRLRHSRGFLFALVAVAMVWVVSSMSEYKHFRENYRIVYDGIDRAHYAVIQIDSIATLDIVCNGFSAFNRDFRNNNIVHINVSKLVNKFKDQSGDIQFTLNTEEYMDVIKSQIDTRGVSEIAPVSSRLNIHLSPRHSKAFVPDISPVKFQFVDMVGLCGEPKIRPDTIWLYGSQASLDKVSSIKAAQQTIKSIRISGEYRIRLDTAWHKYSDLHISTNSVSVYIPVENYIEKEITLPIQLQNNERTPSSYKINLYPAEVKITCIVPQKEYNSVNNNDFAVTAVLDNDTSTSLTPVVTTFPANVRIKSITPSEIQYIVIK